MELPITLTYIHRPLASKVLCVAVINEVDWSAYIDAVPGKNHEDEYMEVAKHGTKLKREMAEFIFPGMECRYRD